MNLPSWSDLVNMCEIGLFILLAIVPAFNNVLVEICRCYRAVKHKKQLRQDDEHKEAAEDGAAADQQAEFLNTLDI
jgi:heme exporter protein D